MQTISPQTLFATAEELLTAAEEELNRAEEDAVTHLICHHSRQSIANCLMGFLLEKGEHLPYPPSLDALLGKCQALDARFRQIDLSPVNCRFEPNEKDYCLDLEAVGECFRLARQTQQIIWAQR